MTRNHLFSSGLLMLALLSVLHSQGRRAQPEEPAVAPVPGQVPIGGIILWWGRQADIPEGFEACDGTLVSTKDAVLKGTKPDLEDKFPRGAPNYRSFVPQSFKGGGSDEISLELLEQVLAPHELTEAQLPAHTHAVPDLKHVVSGAPSGRPSSTEHTHTVTPKTSSQGSHRHAMDHLHAGAPHKHELVAGTTDNGNQDGAPSGMLDYNNTGTAGSTGNALPLDASTPFRTGLAIDSKGNSRSLTDPETFTLPDLNVSPAGGTIADHTRIVTVSGKQPAKILLSHKLNSAAPKLDIRPAYVEVVFLIRVK